MKTIVRIQREPFNVAAEINVLASGAGAIVTFTGLVRPEAGLTTLSLEHYPGMTEREIARHAAEAGNRWSLLALSVIHRVGELKPGEPIVLVIATALHRGDAFAACEYMMDHLKTSAPFWKEQKTEKTAQWVEAKASDDAAAARWSKR